MGRFGVAVTAFLGACLVAVLALGGNRFVPTASAASASTYVALGDSYASGEGLGDYEPGTDVKAGPKRNVCHRSAHAFSQLGAIVLPDVTDRSFWACSGAKATDMAAPMKNQYNQPAQTGQVGGATRWISLFAGGDDLDFGPIGRACAELIPNHDTLFRLPGQPSCSKILTAARAKRPQLQNDLVRLYTTLLTNAPDSALAVLGYPRIFPASYDGVPKLLGSDFCVLDHYVVPGGYPIGVWDLGMPVTDAQDIDEFVTELNDTVSGAVDQVKALLGGDAFRIRYVDTYDSSVPRNCKGKTPNATAAAGELTLGRGIGGNLGADFISSATFHPTTAGQQMFAQNVQTAFLSAGPVITTTALPEAVAGKPYNAELTTADHRTGAWEIATGSLPSGLTLDGDTISGTPDAPGSVTLGLRFTDSTGRTATATASLIIDAAPSEVDVSRPSGLAGFASWVHNIPCPAPSPGLTMWVYGEGADYTPGEFDNEPQQLMPPTNALLVRTSWNATPGQHEAHIDCIEASADSAAGGTTVKRITFTQTVTGPASHVVIAPDTLAPGGRMQVNGGAGCGIDTNGFTQDISLFVYLPDSLAGAYLTDAGLADANAMWGPVDLPVPTQAKTQVGVQATCSSNGGRAGAYFYPPAYAQVG